MQEKQKVSVEYFTNHIACVSLAVSEDYSLMIKYL